MGTGYVPEIKEMGAEELGPNSRLPLRNKEAKVIGEGVQYGGSPGPHA